MPQHSTAQDGAGRRSAVQHSAEQLRQSAHCEMHICRPHDWEVQTADKLLPFKLAPVNTALHRTAEQYRHAAGEAVLYARTVAMYTLPNYAVFRCPYGAN